MLQQRKINYITWQLITAFETTCALGNEVELQQTAKYSRRPSINLNALKILAYLVFILVFPRKCLPRINIKYTIFILWKGPALFEND